MGSPINNKKIILIHGLASKPPEEKLSDFWRKSLIGSIAINNRDLSEQLEKSDNVIDLVYWANEIPHHIPDDEQYCEQLNEQITKLLDERTLKGDEFHVGTKEKIGEFFKDRGADLVKMISRALTIQDNVANKFLSEIRLYQNDQYIADKIRSKLEKSIIDAWDRDIDPVILSHSMGTFITYDVLWRFSHRTEEKYQKYRNKRVRMLATMGSPLAEKVVIDLMFRHYHDCDTVRAFPLNIDYWHNYSCLGDIVCHEDKLKKEYFDPMKKLGLFDGDGENRFNDYRNLYNPFEAVSHDRNKDKEKNNPHKSYGYLVQPKLAKWVTRYLQDELSSFPI